MDAAGVPARILGLLGLARRAGKLALGAGAVEEMVKRGRRPLVIMARDIGPSQRRRMERLRPVRRILDNVVDRRDLAAALGRRELAVVALHDPGFVAGIDRILTGKASAGESRLGRDRE